MSASLDTTGETWTIDGKIGAFAVVVRNNGDTNNLLCRVPHLHGDDDFDTIPPGGQTEYIARGPDIRSVELKAAASTTAASAGVSQGVHEAS